MRLQIKKLDGPGEIRLTSNAQTNYSATVATNNTAGQFTCYFNRAVTNTDVISVSIKIYNNEGTEVLNAVPNLPVNINSVNEADTANANFCFTLTLNCPETMSGSYFYIHAILLNADTNAQNVSYGASSYHQTIKKVYIYADKQFLQVYWSSNEQITYDEQQASRESPRTGNIGQNEDAFLHIKTRGMYEDQVVLLLSADNGTVELRRETINMRQNRRVVAFDMAETIQRYRQQTNKTTGNVSFTLKATLSIPNPNAGNTNVTATTSTNNQTTPGERSWGEAIVVTSAQIITAPLWMLSGCSSNNRETETATARTSTRVNANNIIQSSTEQLTVTCTDTTPATKRTSTGTVYVNVNTGETPDIIPTKFRDFRIGFMCHIEGIGRTVNREDNSASDRSRFTVYPFNVYEILLSDLVACGLITIAEAIYLTTTNHDNQNLRTRVNLENSFDKINASLSATKTLISIFRDTTNNNRAKKYTIRKLLAQVSSKQHYFSSNQNEYNNVREICRDAWQKISRSNGVISKIHTRPNNHRYSTNKECPLGEYFLNYLSDGTYRVYVSSNPTDRNIQTYLADVTLGRSVSPNPIDRGGVALHKGGSRFSTGCLTFNLPYSGGNNAFFSEGIFPGASNVKNIRNLNFICIDERNAIRIANNDPNVYTGGRRRVPDTSTGTNILLENGTYNFYRFYDLIEPYDDLGLNF